MFLSLTLILTGCSFKKNDDIDKYYDSKEGLRYVYGAEVRTMNYLVTASTNEFGLVANFVDSLIDYDSYGLVKPALALSWATNEEKSIWTFKLREGVKWMDEKGNEYAEVVAQDFVDSIKYILNRDNGSQTANIVYGTIKNAEKYYNKEIEDFNEVGVRATDKYTVQYVLEEPVPYFLSMLSYVCFLPVNGDFLEAVGDEFGTDNRKLLYNGAYILKDFEPQARRVLVANENYWDRSNVHIKKITGIYNKEARMIAPELFLRGEVDLAQIPAIIIEDWMKDKEKSQLVRPTRSNYYSYFYCFNFDPQFSEEFEPDNWRIAVNNPNFRKSIFYGFDRKAAMLTQEPYAPENRLLNTVVPKDFVDLNGVDYTLLEPLQHISNRDSFNVDLALEYRDKAIEELKGQVKFPIKILLPYNAASSEWANRSQVMKQQLENLLGKDYIDIIIDSRPPTGFLSGTRRNGNYALLECNWGPDYADPQTYTDPFSLDGTYNWPHLAEGYLDSNGKSIYENMIKGAKSKLINMDERLKLFAEAESFLINESFIIPFAVGGGGYVASRLNPFESQYSPFGISSARFKGQRLMEKPMGGEEFQKQLEIWTAERAEKLKDQEK